MFTRTVVRFGFHAYTLVIRALFALNPSDTYTYKYKYIFSFLKESNSHSCMDFPTFNPPGT